MEIESIEQYGMFELTIHGPAEGNPFVEQSISAVFRGPGETIRADGFYDGEGIYKVRCMPSETGEYSYEAVCSFAEKAYKGGFMAVPAAEGNHGPVRVAGKYHFAYADGTPYYSIGTTCYVWELQSDELIEQTLSTLKESAFNKIRFCIFPKHYDYNLSEPRSYPFVGTPMDSRVLTKENFGDYNGAAPGNDWDFSCFNPEHFRHIEKCIMRLQKMGIEADLIVMHPYDRWGFSCMEKEADDRYWRYVTARFSAYRNVWWSLANEYDLLSAKKEADWERYAAILCEKDPYGHLRSIHNCGRLYDHTKQWVTHCSLQRTDVYKTTEYTTEMRERYQKPVVWDEIAYEGDIQYGWGNISARELTRRFWEAAVRGGYPGHGETYMSPDDILWWSHGGILHGESHKRFGFLLEILKDVPGNGLREVKPGLWAWDVTVGVPEDGREEKAAHDYYLMYFGLERPSLRQIHLDDTTDYHVELIDTWNQTTEELGTYRGKFTVRMPGREYMALRMRRMGAS